MKKIELGDKVKCIYTGFTGIVVSRIEFINGCIQYELAVHVGKDNKPVDGTYIDSQSLKIISRGNVGKEIDEKEKRKLDEKTTTKTGGPNHKHIRLRGH